MSAPPAAAASDAAKDLTAFRTHEKAAAWTELHCDKTQEVLVRAGSEVEWSETSAGGVRRKMIERYGGEVARCTTIVEFLPNRAFPQHTHAGGEEFFVLDGVWRDDFGAFPKYSYIRNYIGSSHTPEIGPEGCTILVKLRQMHASVAEPPHTSWNAAEGADAEARPGWAALEQFVTRPSGAPNEFFSGKRRILFHSDNETVSVLVLRGAGHVRVAVPRNGMEIFVVDGALISRRHTDAVARVDQEAINRPNIDWQDEIHRGILRGLRNI
jgi:hypothetical protein